MKQRSDSIPTLFDHILCIGQISTKKEIVKTHNKRTSSLYACYMSNDTVIETQIHDIWVLVVWSTFVWAYICLIGNNSYEIYRNELKPFFSLQKYVWINKKFTIINKLDEKCFSMKNVFSWKKQFNWHSAIVIIFQRLIDENCCLIFPSINQFHWIHPKLKIVFHPLMVLCYYCSKSHFKR